MEALDNPELNFDLEDQLDDDFVLQVRDVCDVCDIICVRCVNWVVCVSCVMSDLRFINVCDV